MPCANGQFERYNQTILDALSCSIEKVHSDKKVDSVKWGLNNTMNQATGQIATELMFGFLQHHSESKLLNQKLPKNDASCEKKHQVRSTRIKIAKYDLRRAPAKSFEQQIACANAIYIEVASYLKFNIE